MNELTKSQVDFVIILVYVFMTCFSVYSLMKTRDGTVKKYLDSGIQKNKQCLDYINNVKGSASVCTYAGATTFVSGLIMFVIMRLLKVEQIYLLLLIMTIVVFSTSYKFYFCFLYRQFCNDNYCT